MLVKRDTRDKRFKTEGVRPQPRAQTRDQQLQSQENLLTEMAEMFHRLEAMQHAEEVWPTGARQYCELWNALMAVTLPPGE
jgi:hypothetical protein